MKQYQVIIAKRVEERNKANGILAQLGEHLPYKQRVTGSSPVGPISFAHIAAIQYGEIAQLARACGSYPQCREFESPSRYVFSGSQMFIWLPDFYANRKSGTRLTLQKDGCRRNGLSTGFHGLLFILFLIAEQLSPRGTRKAPRCLGIGHSFVRLRELLKAPKRRFYICSLFAEIWPAAISTYNTAGRR